MPTADCLLFYPTLPVSAAIMQSCNQGAELAAHLGLISDGCKSTPTKKEGVKNAKAVGILSGFLQLSQAGLADLRVGEMHRVTLAGKLGHSCGRSWSLASG